jgi:uncharacterized protein (TIGR02246 family)
MSQTIAPADRATIERILAHHVDAWNAHDMHAFIADMTPDVEWINVVGMHWRGRQAVEGAHAALHRMPLFANSTMIAGPVELTALSPDIVRVVARTTIDGAGPTPDGRAYPGGGAIQTLIMIRTSEGWKVAHGHTTNVDAHAAGQDPSRS